VCFWCKAPLRTVRGWVPWREALVDLHDILKGVMALTSMHGVTLALDVGATRVICGRFPQVPMFVPLTALTVARLSTKSLFPMEAPLRKVCTHAQEAAVVVTVAAAWFARIGFVNSMMWAHVACAGVGLAFALTPYVWPRTDVVDFDFKKPVAP
jgi:hypothetical protein